MRVSHTALAGAIAIAAVWLDPEPPVLMAGLSLIALAGMVQAVSLWRRWRRGE